MSKQIRLVLSAALITLLFVSVPIQRAEACPPPPPDTLLELYLRSDLIILADYTSENVIARDNENDDGYFAQIERNLSVVKRLKGLEDLKRVILNDTEYRTKFDTAEENETQGVMRLLFGNQRGFDVVSAVTVGKRYLFFLSLDEETGNYYLTDHTTAVRDVEGVFDVYEKRLAELEDIISEKDGQITRLTEWIVKLIEEPATRWDGVFDLEKSFNFLSYETEYPEMADETEPFILDESFSAHTPVFAKELSPAQKTRISEVLYQDIRQAWFTETPGRVDPGLIGIVSNWDKTNLAVYGFSMLQSFDATDLQAKAVIMDFIAAAAGDHILSSIYYEFLNVDDEEYTDGPVAEEDVEKPAVDKVQIQNELLKNFEMRFQYIYARNFIPDDDDGS